MARQEPTWILPIFQPILQFTSLTTKIADATWYMKRPNLPEPTRKETIERDREIWFFDTNEIHWGNGRVFQYFSKEAWVAFIGKLPKLVQHFGKISFFEEKEGYFCIENGSFSRSKGRLSITNISNLDDPLCYVSDDELEERMWTAAEEEFNKYLSDAKKDLQHELYKAMADMEDSLQTYLAMSRNVERLTATNIEYVPKSLKSEIDKIKAMPGIRSVTLIGTDIQVLTQPIVTTYEGVSYFMGEYELLIGFQSSPVMNNLSFHINGFQHPHISSDRVCYGSYNTVMPELLRKRELAEIVRFCQAFLQQYSKSSPFKTIDLFPIWKEGKIISPSTVTWLKKYPKWGLE